MSKRVQIIGHATAAADAFTGLDRETTIDTTRKELRVHDGVTAGGFPQARSDLSNVSAATNAVAGKATAAQITALEAATAANALFNSRLFTALVKSVAGSSDITLSAAEGKYGIFEFTGAITANITVIFPANVGSFFLLNSTTGAFSLSAKATSGATVVLPRGKTVLCFFDGTNMKRFGSADDIFYDNVASGLTASDVKSALDELTDGVIAAGSAATSAQSTADGAATTANAAAAAIAGLGSASSKTAAVAATNGQVPLVDTTGLLDPSVIVFPKRYKAGFEFINNASDANNDIDINAGQMWSDDATTIITLASGLTKRLDATWVVGTNQGGLDTGTKANSTVYYMHAIKRPDTGVVDILFSISPTAPTMPTNYTKSGLIGQFKTDGSGNIISLALYFGIILNGGLFYGFVNKPDAFTTASTTPVDVTDLSITVAPRTTKSRFELSLSGYISNNSASGRPAMVQFVRNTTAIALGNSAGSRQQVTAFNQQSSAGVFAENIAPKWVDLPATITPFAYKVQLWAGASGTAGIGVDGGDSDVNTMGRPVTSFIVKEVA